MSEFVVLLREDPAMLRLSPTEMQAVILKYRGWFNDLRATGRLSLSRKLKDEGGRHVRVERGRMVASDGPYAEAKDVISGVFVVSAASYDEVQTLLQGCPHFEYGWFEVREFDVIPGS